jgi:ferritin-like metal-binding protein YciE
LPISTPQEKFVHELCLVYDAEHRFLEAQQEMIQQASDEELQGMIQQHIDQTQQHIQNFEQEEETTQMIEQSTPQLLQKAMQAT